MKHGWSLDVLEWRRLQDLLSKREIKWKMCGLDSAYRTIVPKRSGVYMLCCFPPACGRMFKFNNLRTLNTVYVGQAKSLRERFKFWQSFQKKKEPSISGVENISPKGGTFIYQQFKNAEDMFFIYSLCPSDNLSEVEGLLIDCFGPSANSRRESVVREAVIGWTVQGKYVEPIDL